MKTFKPTKAMSNNAKRARDMRNSVPPSKKGMTRVGLARMNQLINMQPLTLSTVKRMYSFFSRHEVDKQSKSWKAGKSKAEQGWLGWGGDAGFRWSRSIVNRESAAKDAKPKEVSRKDGDIVGKNLQYPTYLEKLYKKDLLTLIRRMQKDVKKQLKKLHDSEQADQYKELVQKNIKDVAQDAGSYVVLQKQVMTKLQKKWDVIFSKLSLPITTLQIKRSNKASTKAFVNSTVKMPFDSKYYGTVFPAALKESLKASTYENVNLIKSIPQKYLGDLQGDFNRLISGTGANYADIEKNIAKQFIKRNGQVERRAKNIATDQTRKIFANMNNSRLMNAGISEYRWRHNAGSKEPRAYHQDVLNGQIFKYADPPVIDQKTGQRGQPADAINCKCTAQPIYRGIND